MAGKAKLSARRVASPGGHGDGRGVWLVVSETGARKWIFRFTYGSRVTEMGLGNAAVSLAAARDKADEARKLVAAAINPIEAKREAAKSAAEKPTFGQCADALIEAKSSEWRNEKHRAQWRMTLAEYAKPLRALPVDEVDTAAVLDVLQPIWQSRPETASRTKRQKLTRGHHAAMAYGDVPEFIGKLREREAVAALALEFLILTAARASPRIKPRFATLIRPGNLQQNKKPRKIAKL